MRIKNILLNLFKLIFIIFIIFLIHLGIISFFYITFNDTYRFNESNLIDAELASKFGDFFGGFIGTIFSILSVLLLIYTILHQNRQLQKSSLESNFFRMIDYHNQNVNQMIIANLDSSKPNDFYEGRRAFVQFKIQIHRLFEIVRNINTTNNYQLDDIKIADIVYMVFYYGIDGSWISFIEDKLQRYTPHHIDIANKIQAKINLNPQLKLGRPNQTFLSTYFRNMYNAIKMIDNSTILQDCEKKDLIKIYRAQLSNPELYVLFFNLISRFGKNWMTNEYIIKYEFIKNLPFDYCEGYDLKNYFSINYEDEEYEI